MGLRTADLPAAELDIPHRLQAQVQHGEEAPLSLKRRSFMAAAAAAAAAAVGLWLLKQR